MKIAVFHNLPSGGAKRMMFELIRRLADRHEFHVFTFGHANHEFCDIRPFVKSHQIFQYKEGRLFKSPLGRLNQFIRLLNLNHLINLNKEIGGMIDTGDYDFVWVNPCQIQNSPAVLTFIKKTKKIFLCQEPLRILYEGMPARPYDKKESKIKMFLDKIDPFRRLFFHNLKSNDRSNVNNANLIVVNSNFMKESVSRVYNVQPETCYAGVDIDFFDTEQYQKEGFFFSVGSLTPLKGFDFLIRAIGLLPEESRLPLVIASNFENPLEKSYITDLAKRSNVDLRLLLGISDELLKELYNKAKITLYAPIREPFGLVAIESMASGTPVIGVAEGGLKETIIHEKTGYLTNRDEKEFATAILNLLSDPQKLEEFGKAARHEARKNWSWDQSAKNFEKLFLELKKINND
jgi:glycosyltransferase involved in cell wall biosynthesis